MIPFFLQSETFVGEAKKEKGCVTFCTSKVHYYTT
jgi:hypothetical protein